ncbi:hypothetical protein Tco_1161453 [Tanacetum coccineum]
MNLIYDVTSTLTQTALDVFCQNYHIPDTIHPELPGPNQNIRNSPAGKIGVYTRFFDFANFRIPLSRFLVDLFLVDASVFPSFIPWYIKKTLARDPSPTAMEFSAEACDFLATHPTPFQKFLEPFLCLVGLSRYYDLDDNVYPTFLTDSGEGGDGLDCFYSSRGSYQGANCIENIGHDGSGDANQENRSEGSDRACQDEAVTIVVDEEFQAAAANKPKSKKKKRRAVGASGSDHPPKKLREDHGTSSDIGVSTGRKSLVVFQGLLEHSTLAAEVDVIVAVTVPFITSSVTPTPEREGGGNIDFVSGLNLRTQIPSKRSFVSPPPMMTADVTTTNVVGASSASVLGVGVEPVSQVHPSIFADSASIGTTGPNVAGPSIPAGTELSADTFYVSQEMDFVTLRQIYVPKWNVVN